MFIKGSWVKKRLNLEENIVNNSSHSFKIFFFNKKWFWRLRGDMINTKKICSCWCIFSGTILRFFFFFLRFGMTSDIFLKFWALGLNWMQRHILNGLQSQKWVDIRFRNMFCVLVGYRGSTGLMSTSKVCSAAWAHLVADFQNMSSYWLVGF